MQKIDSSLIDEKKSLAVLNSELTEKLRIAQEKESKLASKLQDAKDQAELLEFRVLELEEDVSKVRL